MRLIDSAIPLSFLLAVTAASLPAQGGADSAAREAQLVAKARQIQAKVLTLDTHVDISTSSFRMGPGVENYGSGLSRGQVDLIKMKEGGLDAAFLIVYVGQTDSLNEYGYNQAYQQAMDKFKAIHRLVDSIAPDRAELALTPADALRIHAAGKSVIFIGVENGFPIGTDLKRIQQFYDLGGRYLSLAHNGHSQLSDSNTGEADGKWLWNGLSPLGKDAIKELNRVGFMIDVSHPSKGMMMQSLQLTKAPIIASHSGVRAICDHSRNLDDEQLDALKKNGGVVQLVAFATYVKCNPAADARRNEALASLRAEYGITAPAGRGAGAGGGFAMGGMGQGRGGAAGGAGAGRGAGGRGAGAGGRGGGIQAQLDSLSPERRAAYQAKEAAIMAQYPQSGRATVKDFVDHIDYVVKRIGIDHAGISSDFDGGGGVTGWNSAAETFNVTLELVRRGYTEEQIGKIWSGNLLRVMGEVQEVARKIQTGQIK